MGGATEIAGQQNGTENRGAWNHLEDGAHEQGESYRDDEILREAEPHACCEHGGKLPHFGDAVEEQERYHQRAAGCAPTTASPRKRRAALRAALLARRWPGLRS